MQPTTISFVRHGEVFNPDDIFYGRLPRFRLSKNGRSQATVTAQLLQNSSVIAIYSSPLLRARQTAQIIGKHLMVPIHRSKNLIEVSSPHDGKPSAILEASNWDVYTGSPPEYDQPADILARITQFIGRVLHKHNGAHIAAVTHADPIAFTALWAANRPVTIPGRKQLRQIGLADDFPDHASVLTLSFNGNGERPYQYAYRCPTSESTKNTVR